MKSELHDIEMGFVTSANVASNQVVYLHTDGTVRPVTATTQVPIGIASGDALSGSKVLVQVFFKRTFTAHVAATINAGVTIAPSGALEGVKPVIATAVSGYISMLTIAARTGAGEVEVGVFTSPLYVPAT